MTIWTPSGIGCSTPGPKAVLFWALRECVAVELWCVGRRVDGKGPTVTQGEFVSAFLQEVEAVSNGTESAAEMLLQEMAAVVYGSNTKARRGLGLDETLKLCMPVFSGQLDIDYNDRYVPFMIHHAARK